MAVASGPAGPVLAGPVFTLIFGSAHAQIMNNDQHVWGRPYSCRRARIRYIHFLLTAIATRVSDQLSDRLIFGRLFQANEKFSTFQSCSNL